MFNCHVRSRREQKMNMLRHQNEYVQKISTLAPIPIKRLQKKSHAGFDDKQSPPLPSRKGHEVRARQEISHVGFKSKPQRLEAPFAHQPISARVELMPFPGYFYLQCALLGK
jgi:hypothetical protein